MLHTCVPYPGAYVQKQELAAGSEAFTTEDYMLPTPTWAEYESSEADCDPKETRVKKVRNPKKAALGGCT